MSLYVDVIIPLGVEGVFTYSVPKIWREVVKIGKFVVVPFTAKKRYVGVICGLHDSKPEGFNVKDIDIVVEEDFALGKQYLKFLFWLSEYYMAPIGEVVRAALPYVCVKEQVNDLFKPKLEKIVRWAKSFEESELNNVLNQLKRAPVQYTLLCNWIHYCSEKKEGIIKRNDFTREVGKSISALNALCDRGILQIDTVEVSRLEEYVGEVTGIKTLSAIQEKALSQILRYFQEKDCVLLQGVTSSGKTEVYIHLIQEYVNRGKQVLYLLPEIALTVQIVKRLRQVFGNRVGIYHSGMPDKVRMEMWKKQNTLDPYPIVLGVRSSIFLPYQHLGLVIVDEEHDGSYKQKDPAPRYHGRDAAIMLAYMHGAKVLLGSATPSLESYQNVIDGKYGLVTLLTRFGNIKMPELLFVDLKEARQKKLMKGSFSVKLYEEMKLALAQGKQVILFQNRRGYSTYLQCDYCGAIPRCRHCDVSMTYYKSRNILNCHYCGSLHQAFEECEACGVGHYKQRTPGTERIEEEVRTLFPGIRVARMDLEVMNNKMKFRTVIEQFEAGKLDVLVGTQMVSKGLDFEQVKLVGILDADSLMSCPDFRSEERMYNMLMQVSGRSGRKGEQGKVVIQLSNKENRVYEWLSRGEYTQFYTVLSQERGFFHYPPFYRLIQIELRHKNECVLRKAANELAELLREDLGVRVCGPAFPEIARIREMWRLQLLIKGEKGLAYSKLKLYLKEKVNTLLMKTDFRNVKITFDVDPFS